MINEQKRLADNQKILLETIPDMVLLVNCEGSVEYKNQNAVLFFEKGEEQLGKTTLQSQLQVLLQSLLGSGNDGNPVLGMVNNYYFECRVGPFSGYKGDSLYWVTLKMLTELMSPRQESKKKYSLPKTMIGSSGIMSDLESIISQVARTETTVLIQGESGTGKDLVANLIHQYSPRRDKPFLGINCSAINDTLLESDLFGYEKGAFTGAGQRTLGKFEAVNGGTIFLDEIGDISPRMQAVLLRVLQHGEIIRVGGTAPISVDIRVITATNRDLAGAVAAGSFRLDLYYRLNIFNITVPPLRERKEDMLDLTAHFVEKYSNIFQRDMRFTPEAIIDKLEAYDWPGNVRELENVIQRTILMSKTDTITNENLIFDMVAEKKQDHSLSSVVRRFDDTSLKRIFEQIEKEVILYKLETNRGNVAKTAENLEISKASLYDKMKRHDISAKAVR